MRIFVFLVCLALPVETATAAKEKSRSARCRAGTAAVAAEESASDRYLNLLRLLVMEHHAFSDELLDVLLGSDAPKNPVQLEPGKLHIGQVLVFGETFKGLMAERDFDWAKVREGVRRLRHGAGAETARRETAKAETKHVVGPTMIESSLIPAKGGFLTPKTSSMVAADGSLYVLLHYGQTETKLVRYRDGASQEIKLPHRDGVKMVSGADGKAYALCWEYKTITEGTSTLIDLETGKPVLAIKADDPVVNHIAMRHERMGEPLAAVTKDAKGALSLQLLWTGGSLPKEIHHVPFDGSGAKKESLPSGQPTYLVKRDGTGVLAASVIDGKLRVWDLASGETKLEVAAKPDAIWLGEDTRGGVVAFGRGTNGYSRYVPGAAKPERLALGAAPVMHESLWLDGNGDPMLSVQTHDIIEGERQMHRLGAGGAGIAVPISEFEARHAVFPTSDATLAVSQGPEGIAIVNLNDGTSLPFPDMPHTIESVQRLPDGRVIAVTKTDAGTIGLMQLYGPKVEKKR